MNTYAYYELTGNTLKSTRDNWKTLCPCHSESTPSFFIHKETYLSHCFGCGAQGYLDTLLARAFEMPSEKVRELLGIAVSTRLHQPIANIDTRPTFDATQLAGYKRILTHSYLTNRGYLEDTITNYDARWDPNGRILFPLRNLGGPIIGAAGRTVIDQTPKWYFYGETKKGELLYNRVSVHSTVIVVEGILDVMWLGQHGYHNSVALIGSHPTRTQLSLLKDISNEVILFLDRDPAGKMGQDVIAKALAKDVNVSYAIYPQGRTDPQELNETQLVAAIENRQNYIQMVSSEEN